MNPCPLLLPLSTQVCSKQSEPMHVVAVWAFPGICCSGPSWSGPHPAIPSQTQPGSTSGHALKVVPGLSAVVLAAAASGREQIRVDMPSLHHRGTTHLSSPMLAKAGCCCLCTAVERAWWNRPGPAKPQMESCASCLLDPWLGHGSREGWTSRRKDPACQATEATAGLGESQEWGWDLE